MKITFKDICWFAVVALIFFFLSKCHRDEKGKLHEAVNSIEAQLKEDSLSHQAARQALEGRLEAEQEIAKTAMIQAEIINAKLSASERAVNRLTAAVKAAKLFPIDTSFVTVAPEYVSYCDSLANESGVMLSELSKYKNQSGVLIAAKDRQLNIKDSLITQERILTRNYSDRLEDYKRAYQKAINLAKPKFQVFIGAEIIGNQTTFFQQVGGVISLKTKRNKLWQVSTGIQSNGLLYGRINGNILITFKR